MSEKTPVEAKDLVSFIDGQRSIIGQLISENTKALVVRNPASVHLQPSRYDENNEYRERIDPREPFEDMGYSEDRDEDEIYDDNEGHKMSPQQANQWMAQQRNERMRNYMKHDERWKGYY